MQQREANAATVERMFEAEPVLVDVARAGDVVPGMGERTILTSGPRTDASAYRGGQRRAVAFGAIHEGLAADEDDAWRQIEAGEILVEPCQDHGCIGSVAGIYTASMPVFVVKNRVHGNLAFCNLYEGASPRRLNYGVYDEEVAAGLRYLEDVLGPVLGAAVREAGEIPLKPIVRRALNMGDELHSRNTAASLLFGQAIFPALLELRERHQEAVESALGFLRENDYFFLRLSMAAAKATADASHGVEGSSVVSGMCVSGLEFAIRVSGLEDWIRGPLPISRAKLFDGFTEDDIEWLGGESCMTEAIGLGGFAQATAPSLQAYQGGTVDAMRETNLSMYEITVAENPTFKIPYLAYRGTPTGIDVFAVAETGILPTIDAGLAGKDGGQIGAGTLLAPLECFEAAAAAYLERYGARTTAAVDV
ncbi:MAG TPA: DUF1116 domain-containing protein [Solirubrobacterales bacterium]|nr:DUF1116 domain-containing protein [Solirubrobacterales bacterium]